jgi:hypothetical protein
MWGRHIKKTLKVLDAFKVFKLKSFYIDFPIAELMFTYISLRYKIQKNQSICFSILMETGTGFLIISNTGEVF